MPTMGTCSGTEGAALFGCGLLTSYLFLFIVSAPSVVFGFSSSPITNARRQAFYRKTYKSPAAKKAAAAKKSQ